MITLHESNITSFPLDNGIGVLRDALKAYAEEESNGMFEFYMEYDSEGHLVDELKEERIIKAKAQDKLGYQLFRIYSITKNHENDNLIINAQHITYDLANNFVEKLEARSLTKKQVMEKIGSSTAYPHPFNVTSSNTTTQSSTSLYRTNPLQMVGGMEGSVLQIWGGQIERDNFNLIMHDRRGHDDGVKVTYEKNITGLEARFDISSVITRIFPFVYIEATDEEPERLITVDGKYIDSPHINDYEVIRTEPVDYSSDDRIDTHDKTDAQIRTQLTNVAKNYFKETGNDKVKSEMEVQFAHLWETEEYKDVKVLELVGMGDTATINHSKLKVNATAIVNYIKYDCIAQVNEEVKLGSVKARLTDSVNKIDTIERKIEEAETSANQAIISANGKNTVNYGPDEPSSAQKDDLWFKVVDGEYTQTYRFDGVQWQLVIDMDVNQAKEQSQKAVNDANEAVANANLATQNAQDAIDKAQSSFDKAVESAGIADNALSTAQTSFDKASNAEDLANTSKQLSETTSELVDLLESTVDGHATEITKNANEISRKMNTVDADKKYATKSALTQTSDRLTSEISSVRTDLDGLEIGGRNLLKEQTDDWIELFRPSGNYFYQEGSDYEVEPGQTYTFSIIVDKISDDNVPINLHLGLGRTKGGYNWDFPQWRLNSIPFGKKISLTYTVKETDGSSNGSVYFAWRLRNERLETTIRYKEVKLEKGNKATDWSPAPEDMVTEVKFSSLEQTVDDITSQVAKKADNTELQTFKKQTADSFAQTVNKTEYDKNNNVINNQFSEMTQTLDGFRRRVKDNEGNILTLQETATSLVTRFDNLEDENNTRYHHVVETIDGMQRTISDNKGNINKTTELANALQNRMTDAEGNINTLTRTASSLESTIKNIEMGGTNLVPNTDFSVPENVDCWVPISPASSVKQFQFDDHILPFLQVNAEPTSTGDRPRFRSRYNLSLEKGQTYTLSWIGNVRGYLSSDFNYTGLLLDGIFVNNLSDKIKKTPIESLKENGISRTLYKYKVTFNFKGDTNDNYALMIGTTATGDASGQFIRVSNVQIEKGEYVSDWSPSPIDTQSQITQLSDNINARVKKGDVINQINISDEAILIDGENVHITGQTTIDDASIDGAKIKKASIGSAQIGTIDGAIANLVNVNARSIVGGILSSRNSNTTFNLDDGELSMERANFTLGSGADIEFLDPGNRLYYQQYDSVEKRTRSAGFGVGRSINDRLPFAFLGTGTGSKPHPKDKDFFTGFIANTSKRTSLDNIGNSVVGKLFHVRDKAVGFGQGFSFDLTGSINSFYPMYSNTNLSDLGKSENNWRRLYVRGLRTDYGYITFRNQNKGYTNQGFRMDTTYDGDDQLYFRGIHSDDYHSLGKPGGWRFRHIYLVYQPDVSSDERLKENIQDNKLGLDFIKDIETKTFNLVPKREIAEPTQYGILAQQLKKTLIKHKVDTTNINLLSQDENGYYGVQYNQLIAPTIKAVQELDTKTDNAYQSLLLKISHLESRISQLEEENK